MKAAEEVVSPDHIQAEAQARVWGNRTVRFTDLQKQVQKVVSSSNWWDKWGEDCSIILLSYLFFVPLGLYLLQSPKVVSFMLGLACFGFCHHMSMVKAAHLFGHGSLGFSDAWNRFFCWFSVEFIGAFPAPVAVHGHIKIHHPHTNIIGLGDSSTWKIPFLSTYTYLFLSPLILPPMAPVLGALQLLRQRKFQRLLLFLPSMAGGLGVQYLLFHQVAGLEPSTALLSMWGSRAVFMIPYIHVNIFQHIGLSMYSRDNRPDRLTQMSYGVLNLPRHPLFDWNFGHSIINCHIEHHLFPTLSDKLCLRIKPTVKRFFEENALPYLERTYANRLLLFMTKYTELMVHAPPITEYVAVQ